MLRATHHHPASTWPEGEAADRLVLDFEGRHRRRLTLATESGETVLLDLPKAVAMADGDGLQLEDGRWLRVTAAAEPLVEVRAADGHALMRIAWHLGNRHLPAEIGDAVIRIRPDHVIEAMLVGLGAQVRHVEAPFQPEGGAYGGQAAGHGHDHGEYGHSHHGHHHHDH
jgi:urease accessory protein